MNKIFTFVILIVANISAQSQKPFYTTYDWKDPHPIDQELQQYDKLTLFKKNVVEFVYEDDLFLEYDTEHEIIFVNSDDEVKNNNNIYLYYSQRSEIVNARARVIKPGKQIIEMDSSKMLDSYDEETGHQYKYFAFEGLEKGNIIEVLHVLRRPPNYRGRRLFLQGDDQISHFEFDLYAPANLIFKFHVINDTNTLQAEALTENNHWFLTLKDIPGIEKEESTAYNTLRKQLIYKLDQNLSNNMRDISSYGIASQNIFDNLYNSLDKSDEKALRKFKKGIKLSDELTTDEKIFAIENFVKYSINITDFSSPELSKLESLIENKTASSDGITKLFVNLLTSYNIDHQIVATCDRRDLIFNKEFEAYNYLEGYLIYFPESKQFLAPDRFVYRYGLPPYEYSNNYGLFIKKVKLGDIENGLGVIKFIPPAPYDKTHHNHYVTARIEDDFSSTRLDVTTSSLGYFASSLQPYVELISEDVLTEVAEGSAEDYIPGSKLNEWSFENTDPEVVGKDPMLIKYDITNTDLINSAGDKYLFKAGMLIGPQQELYSEKKRMLPVYDNYKRTFDRELKIIIPEGYVVKNPDDLDVFAEYVVNGKQICLFDSKYTYDKNEINVTIHEYYDQIEYTIDEYPYYRDVVNSASDFNKVTLVLEKAE